MITRENIAEILKHYLIAALWAEMDENGDPLDDRFRIDDIDPESVNEAKQDVETFVFYNHMYLHGLPEDQIGHDLLLTRNGHGAGFWDRGLGSRGNRLTEYCEKIGEITIEVGDGCVVIYHN
jgi:hypothetical protein